MVSSCGKDVFLLAKLCSQVTQNWVSSFKCPCFCTFAREFYAGCISASQRHGSTFPVWGHAKWHLYLQHSYQLHKSGCFQWKFISLQKALRCLLDINTLAAIGPLSRAQDMSLRNMEASISHLCCSVHSFNQKKPIHFSVGATCPGRVDSALAGPATKRPKRKQVKYLSFPEN